MLRAVKLIMLKIDTFFKARFTFSTSFLPRFIVSTELILMAFL